MSIEEQIQSLKDTSAKACQSPEAARKFLQDAGITDLINEATMQHIHENNGKTFLLVEVLESGHDFNVLNHMNLLEYDTNPFSTHTTEDDLPPGNWQIIGKGDELKEEQAQGIVKFVRKDFYIGYKEYVNDDGCYVTAWESLNSLLRSLSLSPQTTLILQKI